MVVRLERVTNLKYCTFLLNIIYAIYHRLWLSVPPLNPHNRHMVTIFGGRCRQYPIDGMLILDLHNSSHHIYSASFNVWNICDSIRFSIEEENFELVSAMLRRGVESHLVTKMSKFFTFFNWEITRLIQFHDCLFIEPRISWWSETQTILTCTSQWPVPNSAKLSNPIMSRRIAVRCSDTIFERFSFLYDSE